jgi:gluconate:H+ symporter, GntP family
MISANTVMTMYADAEHAALFQTADITDWSGFSTTLTDDPGNDTATPASHLMKTLPGDVQETLRAGSLTADQQMKTIEGLNQVLADRKFYSEEIFAGLTLSGPAKTLLSKDLGRLSQAQVERFNRIVLETSFPEQIKPHVWDTERREAAYVTAILGDPNLALLLSAAIAMTVLVRYRKLSFKELAKTTETALMSGGVIILITAGGGAFGGMLQKAGVREAVEDMMSSGSGSVGISILIASFLLASMLKVAQGSSTVAMIATSSMVAAMGVTSETLGCSLAYLAAVIGSGSLVGSWMNDSGFWIFARMSGLTEAEALKSWTVLLAIIGIVGLGFALLFSQVLPLV